MAQALGLVVPIFGPRLDSRVLAADVAMVRLMLEVRYRELESRVEQALASQTANALSSATENFGARRAHLQGEWETGVVTPQRVEAVVAQSQHAISAAVLHLAADCTKDLLAAAAWVVCPSEYNMVPSPGRKLHLQTEFWWRVCSAQRDFYPPRHIHQFP